MKNKKVQILEFGFCWPFSVELTFEVERDRGNLLKARSVINSKKKKLHQNWMKYKNLYIFQICEISLSPF
jgi:hypothetical protein